MVGGWGGGRWVGAVSLILRQYCFLEFPLRSYNDTAGQLIGEESSSYSGGTQANTDFQEQLQNRVTVTRMHLILDTSSSDQQ